MVDEAEENAEADKERREEVDLRNEADQLVFQVDKTLKDLEGKVDQEEVTKAETARDELKTALEGDDTEEIKTKRDALSEVVQELSVKLYEQAASEQQASDDGDSSNDDEDDVVDADFEEVDDDDDNDNDKK